MAAAGHRRLASLQQRQACWSARLPHLVAGQGSGTEAGKQTHKASGQARCWPAGQCGLGCGAQDGPMAVAAGPKARNRRSCAGREGGSASGALRACCKLLLGPMCPTTGLIPQGRSPAGHRRRAERADTANGAWSGIAPTAEHAAEARVAPWGWHLRYWVGGN